MPPKCRSMCCSSPLQGAQRVVGRRPLRGSPLAHGVQRGDVRLAGLQEGSQLAWRYRAARLAVTVAPGKRVERVLDTGDEARAATFEPLKQRAQGTVGARPGGFRPGPTTGPALPVQPLDVAHQQVAMEAGQSGNRARLTSEPGEGLDVEPKRADAALAPNTDVAPECLGQRQSCVLGQVQGAEVDGGATYPPRCIVPGRLRAFKGGDRGTAWQHPRHRWTPRTHRHCVPHSSVFRTSLSTQASMVMARRYRSVVSMRS